MKVTLFQGKEGEGLLVPWPGRFFFALCCLGKIRGGAPFSQLHKSGNGSRVDRPSAMAWSDVCREVFWSSVQRNHWKLT